MCINFLGGSCVSFSSLYSFIHSIIRLISDQAGSVPVPPATRCMPHRTDRWQSWSHCLSYDYVNNDRNDSSVVRLRHVAFHCDILNALPAHSPASGLRRCVGSSCLADPPDWAWGTGIYISFNSLLMYLPILTAPLSCRTDCKHIPWLPDKWLQLSPPECAPAPLPDAAAVDRGCAPVSDLHPAAMP